MRRGPHGRRKSLYYRLKGNRKNGQEQSNPFPPPNEEAKKRLKKMTRELAEPGKGLLAVDETMDELGAKLEEGGLENTPENRLGYVMALFGEGKRLNPYVSGVLLREAMCVQKPDKDNRTVLKLLKHNGLHVGIRVDLGDIPLAGTHGEEVLSGLDTMMDDFPRYKTLGVSFTFANCVFKVSDYTPSLLAYMENAYTLAKFASTSQLMGLVPVLSIEVIHDRSECDLGLLDMLEITLEILSFVVKSLSDYDVFLEGVILKLSPVRPCTNYSSKDIQRVARATLSALVKRIPPAIGGVMLADVNDLRESNLILNEVHTAPYHKPCPITFAWGSEVIKEGLIKTWNGQEKNVPKVCKTISERLKNSSLASMGQLPRDQTSFFITNISET